MLKDVRPRQKGPKASSGWGCLGPAESNPSHGHSWDETERDVFLSDLDLAREWLEMFPRPPRFSEKCVVEIGCGFGALSAVAARCGARRVVGVEIDAGKADTAGRIVSKEFPELNEALDFIDFGSLESSIYDERFDIALSQNSFEHYEDPEAVLRRMVSVLKPGGTVYAGFGPLWRSPFGSHLKEICPLPWAHLWAGDYLIRVHNRARPHDPRTTWDSFGLNRVAYRRFRDLFDRLGDCEMISFLENRSIFKRHRLAFYLLEPLRLVPFLREYLTVSLFVVARKVER